MHVSESTVDRGRRILKEAIPETIAAIKEGSATIEYVSPIQPDERELHKSWRHPEGGQHYFRNDYAQALIQNYNATQNIEALTQLIRHVEPLAKSILEYRCTTKHEGIDELLSRIRIKLWRSLRLYDPTKGTAFSFCAKVISSTAASAVGEAWTRGERFCALDKASAVSHHLNPLESRQGLSDIVSKVRRVRTSCTLQSELESQRWLVNSFIDAEFVLRRHQAADSMMAVFGLSHARSRQLFDLTMVAVRRELIDERRLTPVAPVALRSTKSQALIRYAKFLSPEEFTRLATLLKDVAPSVVYTVKPKNFCAIRTGNREAIRENVSLILCGSPNDRRLFSGRAQEGL